MMATAVVAASPLYLSRGTEKGRTRFFQLCRGTGNKRARFFRTVVLSTTTTTTPPAAAAAATTTTTSSTSTKNARAGEGSWIFRSPVRQGAGTPKAGCQRTKNDRQLA